jgi:hypothetical protein
MKIESIKNEEGRHYVQTWVKALHVMLAWPEERTLRWAEKWEKSLNSGQGGFFNDTPGVYLLSILVPESLKEGLSSDEAAHLEETALCLIERQDSFCYRKPNFNWNSAKQRLDTFFAEVAKKKASKKRIIPFLLQYQKRVLVKRPSNHVKQLLRKTYLR